MKILIIATLVLAIFWAGLVAAHLELIFKAKSFGFNNYADTFSVSLRDNNLLEALPN